MLAEGGSSSSPNKPDSRFDTDFYVKKGIRKPKHGNEEAERRRKRALYGARSSSKIFEFGPPPKV